MDFFFLLFFFFKLCLECAFDYIHDADSCGVTVVGHYTSFKLQQLYEENKNRQHRKPLSKNSTRGQRSVTAHAKPLPTWCGAQHSARGQQPTFLCTYANNISSAKNSHTTKPCHACKCLYFNDVGFLWKYLRQQCDATDVTKWMYILKQGIFVALRLSLFVCVYML